MKRLWLGVAIACGLAASSAAQTVEQLGWMAGDWVADSHAGLVEESWMAPRGGVMLGMSRTTRDARLRVFEFARISHGAGGRISFFAQPGGVAPTEFPLVKLEGQAVHFANDGHDYPTNVRYWREGERLMAEISGKDSADPIRWRYSRRK